MTLNNAAVVELARAMLEDAKLIKLMIGKNATPAPLVYDLTGFTAETVNTLEAVFKQMSHGITLSLAEYDVHDENRHPTITAELISAHLYDAMLHANSLTDALARAQAAANGQSYTQRMLDVPACVIPDGAVLVCAGCRTTLAKVIEHGEPDRWICPNACTTPDGAA